MVSMCSNSFEALEKIQSRFLKYLAFRVDGIYPQRGSYHIALLSRFKFFDLNRRRNVASTNFLKKIVHFEIDCPDLLRRQYFLFPKLLSRCPNIYPLHV